LVPASGFFSWYPPVGLTLFLFVRFGVRYAPFAVAAPLLNWLLMPHAPAVTAWAVFISASITAGGYALTALLLVRGLHVERNLARTRDLALFFVLGAIVAPFLIGMEVVRAYAALGVFSADQIGDEIFRFWIGDATGIVTLSPLLFYLLDPLVARRKRATQHVRFPAPRALLELLAQAIAVVVTPFIALSWYFADGLPRADFLYFSLIPIGWIVLRNGALGASIATFFIDFFTLFSLKFFAADLWTQTELQVFMLTVSITAFTLGVTVSERATAMRKLRAAEWQLARAHDAAHVMTLYLNEDGSWRTISANFAELFGLQPGVAGPAALRDLCIPDDRPALDAALSLLQSGASSAIDVTVAAFAGGREHRLAISLSQAPPRDDEERWILAFVTDITAQHDAEIQLERTAFVDALTGLPNRAGLERRLDDVLAATPADGSSLAVVHFDLDNLKLVNDSLGHGAGDVFLQAVAERLLTLLHPGEFAGRVSGDEFVVVLRGAGATRERSERGLAALSERYAIGGTDVYPAASVGYAMYDDPLLDASEILRRANLALNRAKSAGTGRIKAYHPSDDTTAERVGLIARLHRAVKAREFELHYQPIVDLADPNRGVVALEALLRWREGGTVLHGPAHFLAALERDALMESVGTWIVGDAIRQAARWRAAGLPYIVWINVALRQLWQPHFVDRVASLLNEHGCRPADIVIEVTESDAMRDFERVSSTFRALRELGVKIAIDDFGVGESSLARLRDLPVDILKIDGSFVRELDGNPRARRILERIVDLAGSLQLTTVCEWIETPEQYATVCATGSQFGQGFFFGAAVPAEEVGLLGERPAGV
jgi:diguanylate cyclase (GGDEF)-like protein/PAS domain S-box-containing protein